VCPLVRVGGKVVRLAGVLHRLGRLWANRAVVVVAVWLGVVVLVRLVVWAAHRLPSLLIPVQAAITNLLCVGAVFGVLVATFLASYVPLMMLAALFGLSMDYEVFLVSQLAQHHADGEPPRQAVRSGLASIAKVIAAAAIIMISVFGSFILNGDPTIKQFGPYSL
jgi:predicted RND superfamily exporter protein